VVIAEQVEGMKRGRHLDEEQVVRGQLLDPRQYGPYVRLAEALQGYVGDRVRDQGIAKLARIGVGVGGDQKQLPAALANAALGRTQVPLGCRVAVELLHERLDDVAGVKPEAQQYFLLDVSGAGEAQLRVKVPDTAGQEHRRGRRLAGDGRDQAN